MGSVQELEFMFLEASVTGTTSDLDSCLENAIQIMPSMALIPRGTHELTTRLVREFFLCQHVLLTFEELCFVNDTDMSPSVTFFEC